MGLYLFLGACVLYKSTLELGTWPQVTPRRGCIIHIGKYCRCIRIITYMFSLTLNVNESIYDEPVLCRRGQWLWKIIWFILFKRERNWIINTCRRMMQACVLQTSVKDVQPGVTVNFISWFYQKLIAIYMLSISDRITACSLDFW